MTTPKLNYIRLGRIGASDLYELVLASDDEEAKFLVRGEELRELGQALIKAADGVAQ